MAVLGTEARVPLQLPSGTDLGDTVEDVVSAADGFVSGDNVSVSGPASPVSNTSTPSGNALRNSGSVPPPGTLPNGGVADGASTGARSQINLPENQDTLPSSMFITTHRTSSNNIVITPVATTTNVHEVSNTSSSPTATNSGTNVISNASVAPPTTLEPTNTSVTTKDRSDTPANASQSLGSDSGSVATTAEDSASGDDEISASSASLSAASRRKKSSPNRRALRKDSEGSAVSPSRWRRSWPWSRFRRRRRDKGECSVASFSP